jgi:hypothetical protein
LLYGDFGVDMASGPGIDINSGTISGRTDPCCSAKAG